jgi:hypothetical protein
MAPTPPVIATTTGPSHEATHAPATMALWELALKT